MKIPFKFYFTPFNVCPNPFFIKSSTPILYNYFLKMRYFLKCKYFKYVYFKNVNILKKCIFLKLYILKK